MKYMTYEEMAKLFLVPGKDIYSLSGGAIGNNFLFEVYAAIFNSRKNVTNVNPSIIDIIYDDLPGSISNLEKKGSDAVEFNKKIYELLKQTKDIIQKPNTLEALEFTNSLKSIAQIRAGSWIIKEHFNNDLAIPNQQELDKVRAVFLKQISNLKDEQLKYDMLSFLYRDSINANGQMAEIQKMALTMRANSPLATTEDLYHLILVNQKDKAAVAKIFQDMENMVQKQLTQELKKPVPDLETLKTIILYLPYAAQYLENPNAKQEILQKYDVQKILLPDGIEYVQRIVNGPEEKIREMEARIREMEKQNQTLIQQKQNLEQSLDNVRSEKETLEKEKATLSQDKQELQSKNDEKEAKLQMLIKGAAKIKSGLGSSGVNSYKKLVEEISANKR